MLPKTSIQFNFTDPENNTTTNKSNIAFTFSNTFDLYLSGNIQITCKQQVCLKSSKSELGQRFVTDTITIKIAKSAIYRVM